MSELLTLLLLLAGAGFFFAGTVGLLRFPDVYTRLHAITKADNVGLGLVVAGLLLQAESWAVRGKLLLIWLLVLLASKTVETMTVLQWLFDSLLIIALLWLAWRLLGSADLFKAIVLFIAFGLVMALAWVRLNAPDVALAEAAIGAGLTGALLLSALARLNDLADTTHETHTPGGKK